MRYCWDLAIEVKLSFQRWIFGHAVRRKAVTLGKLRKEPNAMPESSFLYKWKKGDGTSDVVLSHVGTENLY